MTGTNVIGNPPTLEWVGVERLQIDAIYQRSVEGPHSKRILAGMTRCWDWRLCQPLNVSRRADGSLFVVDGQHRLVGALQRNDIPHLPCVISTHADAADEANTFVALNLKRQKLSQGDIFNASLASGDLDAQRVYDLVHRAGLSFARHTNTQSYKPGQIFCGPMLMQSLRAKGESVVANALVAMGEAYQGKVMTRAATLLKALILIYSDDAKRVGFDPDQFISAISQVDQEDWNEYAHEARKANPALSGREALALAMMEQYDACRDTGERSAAA